MIERTQHGDVSALWTTWARSRWTGYGVFVFVVRGVMIDTGFPAIASEIGQLVESLRPRGAFLTHHHEDHAGNVQQLAELGVPLSIDAETLRNVQDPRSIGLYRHLTWKAMRPLVTSFTPFVDDHLALMPTPGHCPNHQAVWDSSTGTCFTGDLFLGVRTRVAHSCENPRAHVLSLQSVIARNPARIFCAHRGYVENGAALLQAKVNWMEDLIGRVEQRLDAGVRETRICAELLGPLGRTHYISFGDYSPRNLIAAIRATRPQDGT